MKARRVALRKPCSRHGRNVEGARLGKRTRLPHNEPVRQERETAMSDIAKPAARKYQSFAEFYPFYLSEHGDRTCRRLHFVGSSLALICLVLLVWTRNPWWLLA